MSTLRTPRKLNPDRLWDYALRLLGIRGYSAGELRAKLATKAETVSVLNEVMAKLKEYGYLDDKKYAETYATYRRENESFGKMRVLRELRAHKVPQTIAERAVNRAFATTDEQALAATYLTRKYRNRNLSEYLQDENKLATVFRQLRRAGFGTSVAISALRGFSSRAAELENLPEEPMADEELEEDLQLAKEASTN